MEAEKCRDWPSARWRPRTAAGLYRRLASWRANGIDSSFSLKPEH